MKPWVARFWSKVRVTDDEACWFWRGTKNKDGHGVFTLTEDGRSRQIPAHSLAYAISHGAIPDGLFVRHTCCRIACCNPKHLYVGQLESERRDRLGRRYGGGARRKLSPDQEAMLRREYNAGVKQRSLARKHGVSASTISRILHDAERIEKGRRLL